jgi:Mor family transcriptional regulator
MLTENPEWIKELRIDDFPVSYREVVELIGVENAVKLARMEGGIQVYRPKLDEILRGVRDRLIKRDRAAGMDYKPLALKYNLTEVWIRQLVDHKDDNRQMGMFD